MLHSLTRLERDGEQLRPLGGDAVLPQVERREGAVAAWACGFGLDWDVKLDYAYLRRRPPKYARRE